MSLASFGSFWRILTLSARSPEYLPYSDHLFAHSGSTRRIKESGIVLEGRSRSNAAMAKKQALKRKAEEDPDDDEIQKFKKVRIELYDPLRTFLALTGPFSPPMASKGPARPSPNASKPKRPLRRPLRSLRGLARLPRPLRSAPNASRPRPRLHGSRTTRLRLMSRRRTLVALPRSCRYRLTLAAKIGRLLSVCPALRAASRQPGMIRSCRVLWGALQPPLVLSEPVWLLLGHYGSSSRTMVVFSLAVWDL